MKLEVGKYYKTRNGRKVGPMELNNKYSWRADMPGIFGGGLWNDDGSAYFPYKEEYDSPTLVSEWLSDGPVRTITRKEIVPGVYGIVDVDVDDGFVGIEVSVAGPSSTELRAAAATLIEIADAMEDV